MGLFGKGLKIKQTMQTSTLLRICSPSRSDCAFCTVESWSMMSAKAHGFTQGAERVKTGDNYMVIHCIDCALGRTGWFMFGLLSIYPYERDVIYLF